MWLNQDGCFVEDFENKCKLVTKGKRSGIMFKVDVNVPEVKSAMFACGAGVVADVDIWHKRIGHVNVQRMKFMQSKEIVTRLSRLRVEDIHKVCEACELGKLTKHAFPQIDM